MKPLGYVGQFDHWADLIEGIRHGQAGAVEGLYTAIVDGIRPRLMRDVGFQNAEDGLHEVMLIVLDAAVRGTIRDPRRLAGFLRTVTHRRVCAHIRLMAASRTTLPMEDRDQVVPRDQWPDALIQADERAAAATKLFSRLRPREREVLVRFYYREEGHGQICSEMGLTHTQFRLVKSRAIARCMDLARQSRATA